MSVAKARLNEAKTKSRMIQQEKRNIYDQISAADDLKKQQQDLTTRLKSQLTLFSVEEIERRIKALEHKQQVRGPTSRAQATTRNGRRLGRRRLCIAQRVDASIVAQPGHRTRHPPPPTAAPPLPLARQTTSMTIKEDKATMEEIKRLASNKPMIRQVCAPGLPPESTAL